ncbi:MAG: bifunctional nuclease family protein [Anaerolineaceae bacterium]|nr:bifunctional nuclease family protein [Anaerolineaceae bacterium]
MDSRPSDALALAARAHVPILVSKDVMDSAGVIPEEDLQNQRPAAAAPKAAPSEEPEAESSSERLSVFEDFLQNLDMDNLENTDDDEPDEEDPKPKK